MKRYRETHKDSNREYKKEWYRKNKIKLAVSMRKNYEENIVKRKLSVKNRRINNRIKVNAEKAAYKARRRALSQNLSKLERIQISALYYYANQKGYHVDHIIPLTLNGAHCMGNLQVISKTLNLAKHAKVGRFTDHLQGICCIPFFDGLKKEHLNTILKII